jgi:putative transposase
MNSLMWTATTCAQHKRDGLRLTSDLTDAEWLIIEPLLPPRSPVGRPPEWPIRE